MSVERRGRLSTLGLTLANVNFTNGSGVYVVQGLRRLTSRFDIGGEFVYQSDKRMPGNEFITYL